MGYHAWRCGMSKYRSKSLGPRCSLRECQWRCSWTSKTAIQPAFAQDSIHQYAVYMLCKKWHQNKLIQSFCAVKANRTHLISTLGIPFTLRVQPTGWFQHPCKILLRPGYLGIITPFPKKTCLKPATGFTGQYPVLSPSCWCIPHLPLVIINSLRTGKTQFQRAKHQQEKNTSDLQFSRKSGIVLRSAIAETALSIMS